MSDTDIVNAVRQYIRLRADEAPDTYVSLHDVLGQILKIMDDTAVMIKIGEQNIAVDKSVFTPPD